MGRWQGEGGWLGFEASWPFLEPVDEESCLEPFPRLAQPLSGACLGGPDSQVWTFVVTASLHSWVEDMVPNP